MEPNSKSIRRKKKKLSKQEILDELAVYSTYVSPYSKAQLCIFYLRGLCWLEKGDCQFAHGIEDLDFEKFLKWASDRKSKIAEEKDSSKNIQKRYFPTIFGTKYIQLYEFEVNNQHKLKTFYTFEQLNEDGRKRVEIRRIFHRHIFEEFCKIFFAKFDFVDKSSFERYLDCLGFSYNYKYFANENFFSKSYADKNTKAKRSIIKMLPSNDQMMSTFVTLLLKHLNGLNNKVFNEVFPLSFKYISSLLNKEVDFHEPNSYHYIKSKHITPSEFLDELFSTIVNTPHFCSQFKNIFNLTELPPLEQLIFCPNIQEILLEVRESLWERYFHSSNTQFAFTMFSFIIENYFQKILNNPHLTVTENGLIFLTKKILFVEKNLFFTNNNSTLYVFNYKEFQNFGREDYFESCYEKRCLLEDKDVQKIVIKFFENENDLSELRQELLGELVKNGKDVNTIAYDQEIIVIENLEGLYYFTIKCENFKEVTVDIEGRLGNNADINLIQFCGETLQNEEKKEIFVFDIHKIYLLDSDTFLQKYVKIILTWIMENNEITKIFHDGRNDCISLHSYFQICPSNYLDTSCLYNALKSFETQISFYQNKIKKEKLTNEDIISDTYDDEFIQLFSMQTKYIFAGINKVLENYESNKNINHLKDKMHELFSTGNLEDFYSRPIDEEFLLYSALDVKYLANACHNMRNEFEKLIQDFYGECKNVDLIMMLLSNGHLKHACHEQEICENEIINK